MADLESLNYTSITDMSTDEALERLRQIRLSRRTPEVRKSTTIRSKKQLIPKVDTDMAAELLKLIKGE